MKRVQIAVIRNTVVESRRQVKDQKGKPISIKSLGLKARLLEHPSTPFHYGAIAPLCGAWKFQKIEEFVKEVDKRVWKCSFVTEINKSVQEPRLKELAGFMGLAYTETISEIWLDLDFEFWSKEYPDWLFLYVSEGSFGQYIARGTAIHRGVTICTVTCTGGVE